MCTGVEGKGTKADCIMVERGLHYLARGSASDVLRSHPIRGNDRMAFEKLRACHLAGPKDAYIIVASAKE
jgi:hypothetical protein